MLLSKKTRDVAHERDEGELDDLLKQFKGTEAIFALRTEDPKGKRSRDYDITAAATKAAIVRTSRKQTKILSTGR